MVQYFITLDQNILLWIQENVRNDILTPFFIFITSLGNKGAIWILSSLLLMIPKRTRKTGLLSMLALLLSFLIDNVLLKNIVARIRPYDVIPGLVALIGPQTDFSFPSGHTGSSFASAYLLYLELPKRYGITAMILAVLIAFSRLYLGVHFPSDVIAGALIGIGIAFFVYKSELFIFRKKL